MPKVPFWIFLVLAVLYFSSARVDVMDVDASQYAEMSREMSLSNDFLHLYDRGTDYLDKPPLLMWVSALSMKVWGVNNFGYKFPSILFALWAIWATYRLARSLYEENTARMAALILGCCQGMFLMTNDVRTDTILMSCVITAIWMIREWEVSGKLWYFWGGCTAIALGMMAKGPVALIVPVCSFAIHWALQRQWHFFFRPLYLAGIVLIGILLLPMSIGLYQQFDLHPEKIIHGVTGVSGLRFFYWTQSFGRITGENVWDNGAPFSFLLENMLWAFLPWIFLFLLALVISCINLVKQRFRLSHRQEWITTGGFIITYLSLASSSYQLPHYIFVVFPLAAIMTAVLLKELLTGKYPALYRIIRPVQTGIGLLLLIAAALSFTVVFPENGWWPVWLAGLALWVYLTGILKIQGRFFWSSTAAIIFANLILTHHFYYTLLQYQLGSQLGLWIRQENIPAENIRSYKAEDPLNALHFYAQHVIDKDSIPSWQPGSYLLTMQQGLKSIDSAGVRYELVKQGSFFKVSELTPEFILPASREQALKPYYLIRLK